MDNEDKDELQEELPQEEPPTIYNIFTFLNLPQEVVNRYRSTCELLVNYLQSQVLTLNVNVEILQTIAQKRKK